MNQAVRLLMVEDSESKADILQTFCGKAVFMSGEAEKLKRKLEEMLTSSDTEWVNSITVTLNAMYRQFELERNAKRRLSRSVLMGISNARNGELNETLGVYRTLCCDAEIVIAFGVPFPDCPNHRNLPTEWKQKPDVDPNTYTPNKSGKIALPKSKQQINLRG